MKKSIVIIIPNYNGKKLLEQNLSSVVAASLKYEAEVVVADDASNDGSVSLVRKKYKTVKVVSYPLRRGYANVVNETVKKMHQDIIVLLNHDVSPELNFLKPLLHHFSDPNIFAVGCMDKSQEGNHTILRGRGIGLFFRGFLIHKRGEIDRSSTLWVSGGSGAFQRSVWNILGGYDNLYAPFYYEDIDLSYRAQKAGYRVLFEAESVVVHEHEKGAIKKNFTPRYIKTISYRNQCLFMWKNITSKKIILSHARWLPIHLARSFITGDFAFPLGFLFALTKVSSIILEREKNSRFHQKSDEDIVFPYLREMPKHKDSSI